MTRREQALTALHALLTDALAAPVLRNEVVPEKIAPEGLCVLRDGDPRGSGQSDRRHHMRHLDAEIIVEPLPGGLRLRLVCATGEKFYVDLQRDRAGALLEAMDRAIAPEPQTFGILPIDPPGD